MTKFETPFLFRINEVAKILGLSRSSVNRLLRSGRLQSVSIGRSRRITQANLVRFIEELSSVSR